MVSRVFAVAAGVLFRPTGIRRPVGVPFCDHVRFDNAEVVIRFGLVGRVQRRIVPDELHECQDGADDQPVVTKPFGIFGLVLAVAVLSPAPVTVHVSRIVDFVRRHVRPGRQNAVDLPCQLVQPDPLIECPKEIQVHPLYVGRRTPGERSPVASVQIIVPVRLIPLYESCVPISACRPVERDGRGFPFRRGRADNPPEGNRKKSAETDT